MQTLNLDIQDTTEEATVDTVEDIDIEDITLPRKLSLLLLKMQTLNFSLQEIEEVEEATEEATVDTVEDIEDITLPRKLSLLLLKMQTLNLDIQDTTEEATVDTVEDIDIEDIT